MTYNNINKSVCQSFKPANRVSKFRKKTNLKVCSDMESLERELNRIFAPKKILSDLLADSYKRLKFISKSERVRECASWMKFKVFEDSSVNCKLEEVHFCRDRFCPMCAWRRSLKIFGQVSRIMNFIENDYAFIFLTLTVRNAFSEELKETLEAMQNAWHLFVNNRKFKSAFKGYFKAFEITRNPVNGTYHPHYHVILAVNKNYFDSADYISQKKFTEMWQSAFKCDYTPVVHVEKVKPLDCKNDCKEASKTLAGAVAEVAKYSVKSSDYIFKNNEQLTDEIIKTLSEALHHCRMCSFGGIFDKVHKMLKLDDAENGSLLNVGEEEIRPDLAYRIVYALWSCGAYKLYVEEKEESA